MMSPKALKAHLRQVNLQWGQEQRSLAQSGYYLHISEFGGNLKVNKPSSAASLRRAATLFLTDSVSRRAEKISAWLGFFVGDDFYNTVCMINSDRMLSVPIRFYAEILNLIQLQSDTHKVLKRNKSISAVSIQFVHDLEIATAKLGRRCMSSCQTQIWLLQKM